MRPGIVVGESVYACLVRGMGGAHMRARAFDVVSRSQTLAARVRLRIDNRVVTTLLSMGYARLPSTHDVTPLRSKRCALQLGFRLHHSHATTVASSNK